MNRQQLSLVVVLGLISSTPTYAKDPSEQGGGWRTSSEETASSTLSGKLYRNSADRNGPAPYVVLDRWGVVRGYVAAAEGVELESCIGQQVSLQGTIKTLPGGDMPYMTCQRVLGGNGEPTHARVQHASAPTRRDSFAAMPRTSGRGKLPQPAFPRGATWPPIRRPDRGPLHEVALETQDLRQPTIPRTVPARRPCAGPILAAARRPCKRPNIKKPPHARPSGEVHRHSMATDPKLNPALMGEGPMVSEVP